MTRSARMALSATFMVGLFGSLAHSRAEETPTYLLRYKFRPGEILRWEIEQRAQVRTTVGGTTQTAETTSTSIKAWKVNSVDAKGQIMFVHSVESVDMKQKLTGRQDVHYNSLTDKEVPPGFESVAKAVGVPLTVVTMDATGKVLKREEKEVRTSAPTNQLTLLLPEEPVPVGHKWQVPEELTAQAKDKSVRKIKMRRQMTLEAVDDGIATINIESQLLTPVDDPAIEAQIVQSEAQGKVKFDIEAGRIRSQQTDMDKNVVGFQGDASSLHYLNRFVEKLLPPNAATAAKPKVAAGPELPPAKSPPKTQSAPPVRATRPTTRK